MSDLYRHIPIHTTIATIELMTPDQRSAVSRLAQKNGVNSMSVLPDIFGNGSVTFTLCDDADSRKWFLNGLITPEGSVHT